MYQADNELPIIQKTFDMLLRLIPKLDEFPQKQKYLQGEHKLKFKPFSRVQ